MSDQQEESDACWACQTPLSANQKVCLECNAWQNWRRHANLSTTTLALIVSLVSTSALLIDKGASFRSQWLPQAETELYGVFHVEDQRIDLVVTNWGDVPAGYTSNLRCVFQLPDAISHPNNTNEGLEVEFWSNETRIVEAGSRATFSYWPQTEQFEVGQEQVICFLAMNYLNETDQVIYELLTFVPADGVRWIAVEAFMPLDQENADRLYPRNISEP